MTRKSSCQTAMDGMTSLKSRGLKIPAPVFTRLGLNVPPRLLRRGSQTSEDRVPCNPTASSSKAGGNFFVFLADYYLSKRIDVYAALEYSAPDLLQMTNTATTPATPNGAIDRTSAMVGVRHRF